jgi:malate/lactate dehydrogenase
MSKDLEIVKSHGEMMDYYTIVRVITNPDGTTKNIHVHASSKKMAQNVVDCYDYIKKYGTVDGAKFSLFVRDKATQLLMNIRCWKKY